MVFWWYNGGIIEYERLCIIVAKKVVISIDESLLADIESYAAKMHLNRSAAISVLCSTSLQAQKSMSTLDELMQLYKAEQASK